LRGLDPRIHVFFFDGLKAWMAGSRPAKTKLADDFDFFRSTPQDVPRTGLRFG
jgi:hypothetical protein